MSYKFVRDDRKPIWVKHSKICYPEPNPDHIDKVDTSFPGILIKYPNGYQIEDGVHRIAKLQRQGIYQSKFYIVTPREYAEGYVGMAFEVNGETKWTILGEWNYGPLGARSHDK